MSIALQFPAFPIVMETYRACLQDVFDMPALREVLRAAVLGEVRVHDVETATASPFARSLVFAYVAAYLYEGDSPAAERRAQALSLDLSLLRELLGEADLRDLLDADLVDEVEDQLQRRVPLRRARNADELHDLLRHVGDLSLEELGERSEGDPAEWLEVLRTSRRAFPARVAGREVWLAVEDVGLYRDALGTAPPQGVPAAYLTSEERPVEMLLLRWARTHGPFTAGGVARRFGMVPAQVRLLLQGLLRNEAPAASTHRPARYHVLGRTNSAAIRAPCVLVSRMSGAWWWRGILFQQPLKCIASSASCQTRVGVIVCAPDYRPSASRACSTLPSSCSSLAYSSSSPRCSARRASS